MNDRENAEASLDYELAKLAAAHLKVADEARKAAQGHESRAAAHDENSRN